MKIQCCRIRKSKVIFDSLGVTRIFIKCKFKYGYEDNIKIHKATFSSSSSTDKQYVTTLMRFANVRSVKKLKNKVVRVVLDNCGKIVGFGDPILDEFFIMNYEKFEILTERELKEKYKCL